MNIKPLADRVLVEPKEAETKTASGIYIPDTAKEKPQAGKIVAVGSGKKDEPMELKVGDIVLDREQHRVYRGKDEIRLGPTEFRLLHYLMKHAERVHSRAQLLDKIWGDHVYIEERTVDVHIRHLRAKLAAKHEADKAIETVRGLGYRFNEKKLTH